MDYLFVDVSMTKLTYKSRNRAAPPLSSCTYHRSKLKKADTKHLSLYQVFKHPFYKTKAGTPPNDIGKCAWLGKEIAVSLMMTYRTYLAIWYDTIQHAIHGTHNREWQYLWSTIYNTSSLHLYSIPVSTCEPTSFCVMIQCFVYAYFPIFPKASCSIH